MTKLSATAKAAMETDQGREIQKNYDNIVKEMAEFEGKAFSAWCVTGGSGRVWKDVANMGKM